MKIKIIEVDNNHGDSDTLTLAECGFEVGDIVEIDGSFNDGSVCVKAIRNTDFIKAGDSVSVSEGEYVEIEE